MTSQLRYNCDVSTWNVISNSLDIDFVQGDIHDRSCEKPWSDLYCYRRKLTICVVTFRSYQPNRNGEHLMAKNISNTHNLGLRSHANMNIFNPLLYEWFVVFCFQSNPVMCALIYDNKIISISQISQCIRQRSHNAPFCNKYMHTCAPVGLLVKDQ